MSQLWVIAFNVVLVVMTIPAYTLCKAILLSHYISPASASSRRTIIARYAVTMSWRIVLLMCFWIRTDVEGGRAFAQNYATNYKPIVLVSNHISFFDIFLLMASAPVQMVGRVRMLAARFLFESPFVGTLLKAAFMFEVPFAHSGGRDFNVDKAAVERIQVELQDWLRRGNAATWFPEGITNQGDSSELGLFRAGGFDVCTKIDVCIWTATLTGNDKVWPVKASIGGHPAQVRLRYAQFCPSSFEFLQRQNTDGQGEEVARRTIANSLQSFMQNILSDLTSDKSRQVSVPAAIELSEEQKEALV